MQMRNTFDPKIALPVTYNKALTTQRMYDIAYDLSTSLKLDYNATAQTRIDELPGDPKTQANRDTILQDFLHWVGPHNFIKPLISIGRFLSICYH